MSRYRPAYCLTPPRLRRGKVRVPKPWRLSSTQSPSYTRMSGYTIFPENQKQVLFHKSLQVLAHRVHGVYWTSTLLDMSHLLQGSYLWGEEKYCYAQGFTS